MEDQSESCELQQLVSSDAEGDCDDTIQEITICDPKVLTSVSPVVSNKCISLGDASQGSVTQSQTHGQSGIGSNHYSSSRLMYMNEKRSARDIRIGTARPRTDHKGQSKQTASTPHHCFLSEVPDVRQMERALVGLLADFHSGKLRAFGKGCTMEQMTDIREQQELLARLHFDLGAATATREPPLSTEGLRHSHNTMMQLVQRLENLSVSIEQLHSNDKT